MNPLREAIGSIDASDAAFLSPFCGATPPQRPTKVAEKASDKLYSTVDSGNVAAVDSLAGLGPGPHDQPAAGSCAVQAW